MSQNPGDLYRISATLLDGTPLNLGYFKGKVLLIVNTASQCGFTPQYAALEQMYERYRARGFEVLGFPCNQFGGQEPGEAAEIGKFCERRFGVSFPLFAKIEVNGPGTHAAYELLKAAKPGFLGMKRIKWNFTKFLVDRRGNVVSRHAPNADPRKLGPEIETLLAAR